MCQLAHAPQATEAYSTIVIGASLEPVMWSFFIKYAEVSEFYWESCDDFETLLSLHPVTMSERKHTNAVNNNESIFLFLNIFNFRNF